MANDKKFAAILFDLDGTLVDSIPFWIEANIQALKSLGVRIDAETFLKDFYHQGLHYEGILEKLSAKSKNSDQFYRNRDDLFTELVRTKIEWIDGTEAVMKKCAANYPLGMMTGSRRGFIDAMDERLKLTSLFSCIITRDDTGMKMKPDPFGLLLLAERLGVKSEDCLYVGDQKVDVDAAKNAGMSSCLIQWEQTPEGAEDGADYVIETIKDLKDIIGE